MICVKLEDGKVVEAMRSATLPEGWLKVVKASEPFTAGPDEIGITSDLTFQQITQCEQDGDLLEFVGPKTHSPEILAEMERMRLMAAIDAERDRRIALGFVYRQQKFQSRPQDVENIIGQSIKALSALMGGAEIGDLFWNDPSSPFVWILENNQLMPLDAQDMFDLGEAFKVHKTRHIFAARFLKNADPIPADFTDDSYWPPLS